MARVDVEKLIQNIPEAGALKAEYEQKIIKLQKWAASEKNKIEKASGDKRKSMKAAFEKKHNQQLQEIQADYTQKLNHLDAKITKVLHKVAEAHGFNIVLAKTAVLDGGTDITAELIELVK